MAASVPSKNNFHDCVSKIFQNWTVLRLAVEQGFGGVHSQEKANWMVDAVDQWFSENSNLESYEVEDFLAEILSNEFDTVADDGSLPQISSAVCKCFTLAKQSKYSEIETILSNLSKPDLQKCLKESKSNEEESDSSEEDCPETSSMDIDATAESKETLSEYSQINGENVQEKEMEDEDDGWTVVRKGKKR